MSWSQEIPALARRMFALAGVSLPWQVEARKAEELTLSLAGNPLTVCAPDLSGAGRGLFQAACALKEGRPLPHLPQKRRIASCGMMLDMSRGGVMTVEAVKRMIDAQAALGLNLMMLYTEDTYPVADYPYLGYLRGRYTGDELRERLGRAPRLGEVAAACGMDAWQAAQIELLTRPLSVEGSGEIALTGAGGIDEERLALRMALDALPGEERRVILLRYFRDATQQETARLLGKSQAQISRIERRALAALRAAMS